MESDKKTLLLEIQSLQQLSDEKDLNISKMQLQVTDLQRTISEQENRYKELTELSSCKEDKLLQASDHTQSLDVSLSEAQTSIYSLTRDIQVKEEALKETMRQISLVTSEKDDCIMAYKAQLSILEEKCSELMESVRLKEEELQIASAKTEELCCHIEALNKLKNECEDGLRQSQEQLTNMTAEVSTVSSQLSIIKTKLHEQIKCNQDLAQLNQQLQEKKVESDKATENMRTEHSFQLQQLKQQLTDTRTSFSEQKEQFEAKIDRLETEKIESSKVIENLKIEHNIQVERLQGQLKEFRVTIVDQAEQFQAKIGLLESEKIENDKAVEKLRTEHNVELQELKQHLIEARASLAEQKEQFQEKITQLEADVSMSRERANAEQQRIEEAELECAQLHSTLAQVQSDRLELEVRLEVSENEQQNLTERCLSSESEVESLTQTITQLRRKYDDSTAALHELGRQNQALQLETNKLSGRKWAEDEEVQSCSNCSRLFSMTVRRHHCRNCGQIFCGECSSRQAVVQPNKRPVRVCDSCHTELITAR